MPTFLVRHLPFGCMPVLRDSRIRSPTLLLQSCFRHYRVSHVLGPTPILSQISTSVLFHSRPSPPSGPPCNCTSFGFLISFIILLFTNEIALLRHHVTLKARSANVSTRPHRPDPATFVVSLNILNVAQPTLRAHTHRVTHTVIHHSCSHLRQKFTWLSTQNPLNWAQTKRINNRPGTFSRYSTMSPPFSNLPPLSSRSLTPIAQHPAGYDMHLQSMLSV